MAKNKAQILHFDLYGKREDKYDFLNENSLSTVEWTELQPQEPELPFVPIDYKTLKGYEKGFSLNTLLIKYSIGVQTHRDNLVIDFNKEQLTNRFYEILNNQDIKELKYKYNVKEGKSWQLKEAILKEEKINLKLLKTISYRPFDNRYMYYSDNFIDRSRRNVGKEIINDNLVLNFPKIVKINWEHLLVTNSIPTAISLDINGTYFAPLYLYPDNDSQQTIEEQPERIPNFNMDIVKEIEKGLGITFTNEKTSATERSRSGRSFAPIDILDYIYAVLHSPTYREKYKEFLKIDFPRVPYPKDKEVFWQLVKLGGEIRQIHLLESSKVEEYITTYPMSGSNEITRKLTLRSPGFVLTDEGYGQVWINDEQYFDKVPLTVWEFYIGGYQPAQKWLKDRVGRTLDFEDILHYQKIIVALSETDRIMKEIDKIEIV